MTPDRLRDIAHQLDQLRKEQQARAIDENQRDVVGLHTLSMLLAILCVLFVGLLWALAERYWASP